MQKLRLEIGLPGGSVNRNLGDQILKQVQDDQEGKDMLVVEDGIWKNDETVLAAVRMRKVAIENRPPRRFCESQLVDFRQIQGFSERKAEVTIGNRPHRAFCESQLGDILQIPGFSERNAEVAIENRPPTRF